MLSASKSDCFGFVMLGQLSILSNTPSLSLSAKENISEKENMETDNATITKSEIFILFFIFLQPIP